MVKVTFFKIKVARKKVGEKGCGIQWKCKCKKETFLN